MTQGEIEIQLLAVVVAAACALPGAFLVLRKMAMMSDAISHAILPGIVIAFFLTHNLNSPLLILAAAATGVLTVMLVELLMSTRLVREDAAIGLTFPVLFSIGIILIARYAGDVHLDTDAVLLGEPAFAPFDRLVVGGRDIGPRALYVMSAVGLANVAFIALFYKELKIATFDAGLAAALGFGPVLIHYGLMTFVSITAVAAFDAVGSILVVAMMVAPSAAAYLLTDRLRDMILLSVALGAASAVGGFQLARLFDVSIAGAMATVAGVVFLAVWLGAPRYGILAGRQRRIRQKWEFAEKMLAIHLFNHEGLPEADIEHRIGHLEEHLSWEQDFARRVVRRAQSNGLVRQAEDDMLVLTPRGREAASEAIENL